MNADADSVLESLSMLVPVIGRDRTLSRWFRQLNGMSAVDRRNQVFLMLDQMTKGGKDGDVVIAFRLLADPRVFEATKLALQDSGYIDD